MGPPDAGDNGITPELPQNPRKLRAVEPVESEPAPCSPERPPHNVPSELSGFETLLAYSSCSKPSIGCVKQEPTRAGSTTLRGEPQSCRISCMEALLSRRYS
jgi:hypothetical protein